MKKLKSKITALAIATSLVVSTNFALPTAQVSAATTEKTTVDKVKISSSIKRTFNEDDMDYFQFTLKNTEKLKFVIKDSKKKKMGVVIFKGLDEKFFTEEAPDYEDMTEEDAMDIIDSIKIISAFDNLKGEDSVGTNYEEIGLTKGTYTVFTFADDTVAKSNRDFVLSITKSTKKYLEIEGNDSRNTATPILKGQVYQAGLGILGEDVDNFKVTVPQSGKLVLKSTTKKRADMSYQIYDANKKKLNRKLVRKGNNYVVTAPVKKGTYYIRVTGDAFSYDMGMPKYSLQAYVKTADPVVTVKNLKGSSKDNITISGLKKGTKVSVYSDVKKKKLITSRTSKGTKLTINTKRLSDKGGNVYIVAKNEGLYSSSTKNMKYKKAK